MKGQGCNTCYKRKQNTQTVENHAGLLYVLFSVEDKNNSTAKNVKRSLDGDSSQVHRLGFDDACTRGQQNIHLLTSETAVAGQRPITGGDYLPDLVRSSVRPPSARQQTGRAFVTISTDQSPSPTVSRDRDNVSHSQLSVGDENDKTGARRPALSSHLMVIDFISPNSWIRL